MKRILLPLIAVASLFIYGCGTVDWAQVQKTIGTPQNVQTDIQLACQIASPHIPADSKVRAQIHSFATHLGQASNLDLAALYALLPATTGSSTGDFAIAKAKDVLNYVVGKYGSHNATTLAYAKAISNAALLYF